MGVSVDDIKKLRELTGVRLTDIRKLWLKLRAISIKTLEANNAKKGLTAKRRAIVKV